VGYLTFFKTKKIKKEKKKDGYRTEYEFIETNERFKFPLWSLLLGFVISLIPIVGIVVFLWATIKVANMTNREYESMFDGNRPSFYIVRVFSKEI
jgi:hypothetical protein